MEQRQNHIEEYREQIEEHQKQIIFLSGAIRGLERLEKESDNKETTEKDDTDAGSTSFSVDVTPEEGPIDG